jgi:hypothetical protein
MDTMMPQPEALADLSDDDLRKRLDYWTYWLWDWDYAQRSSVPTYCCEGSIVRVLLSVGMAEAERRLSALRQEAERRPSMQDEVREWWPR